MEVLQRTANRGSISDGGYEIDNSVKLQTAGVNSEFFERSFSSSSNRQTWTYSTWLKLSQNGVNNYFFDAWKNSNTFFILGVSDAGRLVFYDIVAGTDYGRQTDRLLRDTSAWYHVVFVSDTTNGTAADRYRLYVNGVRETSFSTSYGDPPQNYNGSVNDAIKHRIGYRTDGSTSFNGYLAETILVDGTALDPDSFGEVDAASGIWKPIDITDLSVGTNGVLMKYENAASMGAATSGTGFSVQNINQNDQATDVPSNNFATFNVAQPRQSGTTIAQGGTEMYVNSNYQTAVSSIAVSKGKWYAEFIAGGHTCFVGFVDVLEWTIPQLHNGYFLGYSGIGNTLSVGMKGTDGVILNESNSATGATFGNGDIISVALDMDNRKAYFAVNGTYVNSGNPATAANPILWYTQRDDGTPWTDVITMGITGYSNTYHRCNFGGYSSVVPSSAASDANGYGTFEYAPPTGYYALCTKNLAEYG